MRNVVYQDNQSAIRMKKNGRNSCTGNSRHINIKFFFVKDRVKSEEIIIVYCPTHLMLADYYTKPLQGNLFKVFWKVIMGHAPISSLASTYVTKKEYVGNQDQSVLFVNNTKKDAQRTSSNQEQKSNLPPTPKSTVRNVTEKLLSTVEKVAVKDTYCSIASRGIRGR